MLPDRFWVKVTPAGGGECWLWTAGLVSSGYGKFKIEGKHYLSHRLAYFELIGEIPADLQLDHRCRVRICCNPYHLEPVPRVVNILRGVGAPAVNARRLTCLHGHPLAGENLALRMRDGLQRRVCRTCQQGADARYKARLRRVA